MFILKFILRILLNAGGIYIANSFIPGFMFEGTLLDLGIAALALTIANDILGGILRFIFRPIIFITLGVFSLIISIATLWLTDFFLDTITISSLSALLFTTVIIAILNLPLIKTFIGKIK
ncbi:hypothetical protein C4553_03475 [Candidatus Parcubacteria bacterium]|nr:MAG: hypothetical protein C4553_03475 [Candidatus Parcubacteria bacterium]